MARKEPKDRTFKFRAPDRLVTEATAAAEADGLKVSELVRQALVRELAVRGERRLRQTSALIGNDFASQEQYARDYAEGGTWLGRMTLGMTLMGLGGSIRDRDPARALAAYQEARVLFEGCAVDSPYPDCVAGSWAKCAEDELAGLRDGTAGPGVLLVLPPLAFAPAEASQ
jgi:hypothetical protein